MKIKDLTLLFIFSILFACTPTKITTFSTVEGLLADFEKNVLAKDWTAALDNMDVVYKKEQHDDMLKGNTVQFFSEFFCGEVLQKGRGYKCLETDRIKSIKRVETRMKGGQQEVIYEISGVEGTVIQLIASIRKDPNSGKFGLVGSVG